MIEDVLNRISTWLGNLLLQWGLPESWINFINSTILLFGLVVIFYVVKYVLSYIVIRFLRKVAQVSGMKFFHYLVSNKLAQKLGTLVPVVILSRPVMEVLKPYPIWMKLIDMTLTIAIVIMSINLIMSIIKSAADKLRERPAFQTKPIESYLQVIKIIAFLIGAVVIFSHLTGKSPTAFFAAMGAASAVLMLMFKDTIMGLVASVQVTTNDMVRIGDWITMNKYGADGDVVEINLTTVKVQNFDKTITTIPTYAIISDSFQNWRGMQTAGGRRIKRSIIIKQSSIRYIGREELDRFKKIQGISQYIDERQTEIDAFNDQIGADRTLAINGRNLTNAGLFRKYAEWYIQNHPDIHKGMSLMVRHLAPTPQGLPFELYTFTNTTDWLDYESVMADIFDHLIAAVPYFDLLIFEEKSGSDVLSVNMMGDSVKK